MLGEKNVSIHEVTAEINVHFKGLQQWFYLEALQSIKERWREIIDLKGEYVED